MIGRRPAGEDHSRLWTCRSWPSLPGKRFSRESPALSAQVFSIGECGRDMFAAAERLDLEGITAKRKADPYAPGVTWYKIKTSDR